jgi:hypothetical protein
LAGKFDGDSRPTMTIIAGHYGIVVYSASAMSNKYIAVDRDARAASIQSTGKHRWMSKKPRKTILGGARNALPRRPPPHS